MGVPAADDLRRFVSFSSYQPSTVIRKVHAAADLIDAIAALPTDDDSQIPVWYNADEARGYESGYIAAMHRVARLLQGEGDRG